MIFGPWRANLHRVIDADTVQVDIDLGFHIHHYPTIRLARVDAPERGKPGEAAARQWLTDRLTGLAGPYPLIVENTRYRTSHGRYEAELKTIWGHNISDEMLTLGHAKPWKG